MMMDMGDAVKSILNLSPFSTTYFTFSSFNIIKELNCTFCYRINGEITKGEHIAKLQYVQVVVIKKNNIN